MLQIADYFFLIFHALLIAFNLFGWIPKRWRKAHLVVILLTFASWFGLGIWYGWGYCPFTDWHWDILRQLGHYNLPPSYVSYLFQRVLGITLPHQWVDILTVGLAVIALILSIKVNFFQNKT